MKLSSIPAAVVTANRDVHTHLANASKLTQREQAKFEADGVDAVSVASLSRALGHANDAVKGIDALDSKNLLDGATQRWANHSVRELRDAVAMLERPGALSKDGIKIFGETLFDAEVATRLSAEAGARSLDRPALRAQERGSSSDGSGSDSSSGGPTWVDGEWLDELGNPARRGGEWTGPDGTDLGGWDGGGSRGDGGWTGPDGEGYSGI